MKKRIYILSLTLFIISAAISQNLNLKFTAVDNFNYVQLDSIKVINRTHEIDTVLNWPDTVLSIYNVGISEITKEGNDFHVLQNYPNPVKGHTTISLIVPEKGQVYSMIIDMIGRVILSDTRMLDKGVHYFRFDPGNDNLYFFNAQWKGNSSSIKILQTTSQGNNSYSLKYTGSKAFTPIAKAVKDIQNFSYSYGDELLFIGNTNNEQSGILASPEEYETYTFQFATNIPCKVTPTVDYNGQVYNTIQIFSQCWLKENLNVGTMIQGNQNMADNNVIEKYCYNNEADSCAKYGGLYQWDEMMQYTSQNGIQGICPQGWHLPSDNEWKILEGATDNQHSIGDVEWEKDGTRGYNAGLNLKTTDGWYSNGNGSDLFDFSGIPSGNHWENGNFEVIFFFGYWWTTKESEIYSDQAYFRQLSYGNSHIIRLNNGGKNGGFSVRCLRGDSRELYDPNFTDLNDTTIYSEWACHGSSYYLDFENDSLDDIKVYTFSSYSSYGSETGYVELTPLNGYKIAFTEIEVLTWHDFPDTSWTTSHIKEIPEIYLLGDTIQTEDSFTQSPVMISYFELPTGPGSEYYSGMQYAIEEETNYYIAFRNTNGINNKLAWLKVKSNGAYSITLSGCFYNEDEPYLIVE